MRTASALVLAIGFLASQRVAAVQDCHPRQGDLAKDAPVIAIVTIESIGSRNFGPCPGGGSRPEVCYSIEQRCGPLQTLKVRVERFFKGTAPKHFRVIVPAIMGLTCDDPPTIEVGARIGVFVSRERHGDWVVCGMGGMFNLASSDDEAFRAQLEAGIEGAPQ